jgi:hypothetical protein
LFAWLVTDVDLLGEKNIVDWWLVSDADWV